MDLGQSLLSLSRPIVFLLVIAWQMAGAQANAPLLALCAVSASFYLVSSAMIVDWIPVSDRSKSRLVWMELALAAVLHAVASTRGDTGVMETIYAPIAVTIFLVMDRRHWIPAGAALVVVAGLIDLTASPQQREAWGLGLQVAGLIFFCAVGMLIRNLWDERDRSTRLMQELSTSRDALQRALRQVQESAATQQHFAVLEERQRLAREIHDNVAHGLTALVVQVQAARRLLERTPDQAPAILERCEKLARESLIETRHAVRALHPSGLEQQSEVEALQRLGRDFGLATGMTIDVTADERVRALPANPERLVQIYRIFQESLTNAYRHGQARQVTASLAVDQGALCLTVTNDGLPPALLEPGVGLKSMRERAGSLGGSVSFEPGARGLTVRVAIPLGQEEAVS